MAKQYKIVAGDYVAEFTAAQYLEAKAKAYQCADAYPGTLFYLKGDEVGLADFVEVCIQGLEAWQAKKQETHKRVKVLHGASVACYVWRWVKK